MRLRTAGFTLVEVLVASTIAVFIALVAAGSIRTLSASNETFDRYSNAAAEVRFAANLIARDLQNFYRDNTIANTKLIGTVESLDKDVSTSYLVFYTTGRIKARSDQPEGDIYEVEYYLAQEGDSTMMMRRLWPNPNKDLEPGGVLTVIAENISLFEVEYFDGEQWNYEWPEDMQTLPKLISVTITAGQVGRSNPTTESFIVSLSRNQGGDITSLGTTEETSTTGTSSGSTE